MLQLNTKKKKKLSSNVIFQLIPKNKKKNLGLIDDWGMVHHVKWM
jgi:hypothetical protein